MHALKFPALLMLALAVGMAADHPIIISGGSPLRIQHDSWDQKDDQTLASSFHGTVTSVEVKSDKGTQFIMFTGQQLDLRLAFGKIGVSVLTDANGHDPVLKVDAKTSLQKHFQRTDPATFESHEANAAIRNVTLLKGGADQRIPRVGGHTEVVIHYE